MSAGAHISPRLVADVRVEAGDWAGALGDVEPLSRRVMAALAAVVGASGEVAMMLTDDAPMQTLNLRWRGQDKPTDVLSFPAAAQAPRRCGEPAFLGDVAIALSVARRDASAMRRPLDAHCAHLMVHGVLHLLGYDHEEEGEAEAMEALEGKVLSALGFPDPYLLDDRLTGAAQP